MKTQCNDCQIDIEVSEEKSLCIKPLEYIFAIILIGTLLLLFVPLCVYGLIMAVVDKLRG